MYAMLHFWGIVGHETGVSETIPKGFCVFFSDTDPESKVCEK